MPDPRVILAIAEEHLPDTPATQAEFLDFPTSPQLVRRV